MCTNSEPHSGNVWYWVVTTDQYILHTYSKESAVTAHCGYNFVDAPPFCETYAVEFQPNGAASGEYQLNIDPGVHGTTGVYTFTALAMASSDWDGDTGTVPIHTRFYNGATDIGVTAGGFPSSRDRWEQISATKTISSCCPDMIHWYVGCDRARFKPSSPQPFLNSKV
jgi:hypothetical protein